LAARIRKLKGLSQDVVGERCGGLRQPAVSKWLAPGARSDDTPPFLERLATALECRTDYLLGRCLQHLEEREAVSLMALEVFEADIAISAEWKARCRRVVGHAHAPVTKDGWIALAQQVDLAVGTDGPTPIRRVASDRS
jgi:transcriptional regulator with XRE-family HTH domain